MIISRRPAPLPLLLIIPWTHQAQSNPNAPSDLAAAIVGGSIALEWDVPTQRAASIPGTPQVGETPTADIPNVVDAHGLNHAAFTCQRTVGSSNVDSTTGSSYALTSSQQEQTIWVRVDFTDDAGNSEHLTSVATAPWQPSQCRLRQLSAMCRIATATAASSPSTSLSARTSRSAIKRCATTRSPRTTTARSPRPKEGARRQPDLNHHRRTQRQRRNQRYPTRNHRLQRHWSHLHQRRTDAIQRDHGNRLRAKLARTARPTKRRRGLRSRRFNHFSALQATQRPQRRSAHRTPTPPTPAYPLATEPQEQS